MKQEITIDIYSDTICPWCYIGLNVLRSSISEFPKFKFDLIWRPFQLNQDMPQNGIDRQKYLEIKFNGKKNAQETYKKIYEEGLKHNIHFQFEKIKITPNSFASHKLLALAFKANKQTIVLESLFYEYFIEGVDIGNHNELIKIARMHKIFDKNTLKYLESENDNDNLLGEEKYARELGIQGVPCFIINKKIVLFGAQKKKNFLEIFNKIDDEQ